MENQNSNLSQFTGLYPLSKTLRFELKPVGNTLQNIISSGILSQDQHRAESYIQVKKIIDRYHKALIERSLKNFSLQDSDNKSVKPSPIELFHNTLNVFYALYVNTSKDDKQKEALSKSQETLRKIICNALSSDEKYNHLFKKELIETDLLGFVEDEEKELVKEFRGFTTYFTGFHENRKNMYSSEEKSTAIAYRLINDNLPKFIDNILSFEKIVASSVANDLDELYKNLGENLEVDSIKEVFQLNYYTKVLTQTQIDLYNSIIGGKSLEDGTKIKGLNEYINLYNQQQKDKSNRLPKFKILYKQILSDRNAVSWLPEQFNSDNELLESIEKAYQELKENVLVEKTDGTPSLRELLASISSYDLSKIYLTNDAQLTNISQKVYGRWEAIQENLIGKLKQECAKKAKESEEEYEERLKKILNKQGSFSLALINEVCKKTDAEDTQLSYQGVETYFSYLRTSINQGITLFYKIEEAYEKAKDLLNTDYQGKNLSQDNINVEKIKVLLDAIKELQHFIKPLLGDGTEAEKDEKFYGDFLIHWDNLNKITPLYNKVRNYMTRKPYSVDKIKLNFENATLMDGWDLNKETDNTTVILRKDGLYYLAIMNKQHKRVFEVRNMPSQGECFEKMEYKLLPGANKMLPKVFFSKSRIKEFAPSAILLENYKNETHKKGENFNLDHCHDLIDFFKRSINKHEDWKQFNFQFSNTQSYQDLSGFYREVEQQGYKITFRNVSESYVNKLVEEGKIYLFQIYNKDFSPYSKGTPNLHTLYWKMLFDERNLADVVYKLNGQAEIFFRKSSIPSGHVTHPANQAIKNKNTLNKKAESIFTYDLIKNKRFTVDKFQFHVPITMNFKSVGRDNINNLTNDYIYTHDDLHVIGIDRGERHLLYLTVIDMKGNIKEQYSLNEIVNHHNGNEYHTDYHALLSKREEEKMTARKSWQTIENIKELKEGYLSQVIHKISDLMVKYNAIVVLEDLNVGFKRSRQKVESSVYQKFEQMLIDKLNFLADKKANPEEVGGVLKPYQLTSKFESFQKLGKQSGFLFYTQAWNTSKIDPVTGFVNLLDTRYETREKAKSFFEKFNRIGYNEEKGWFEFDFDYSNFNKKAEDTRTKWTICTYGSRIETFRDKNSNSNWISVEVNLTQKLIDFFSTNGIDYNLNLQEQILNQNSAEFFKGLLHLLKLTLQLRNSATGTDIDYMLSPVANESGVFFDSRNCDDTLPKNADANGAYNIARKGLWIIRKIKEEYKNVEKLNLAISNKEWLKFAQEKPYLNK